MTNVTRIDYFKPYQLLYTCIPTLNAWNMIYPHHDLVLMKITSMTIHEYNYNYLWENHAINNM
jgi:hypothetical protein